MFQVAIRVSLWDQGGGGIANKDQGSIFFEMTFVHGLTQVSSVGARPYMVINSHNC